MRFRLVWSIGFWLCVGAAKAQITDSIAVAPRWVAEVLIGSSSSGDRETVKTGPDSKETLDFGGGLRIGLGTEHRLAGRWSARAQLAWVKSSWQGTGGSNIFAGSTPPGDRWTFDLGAVHQLFLGQRSQFTLNAGVRTTFGMDMRVDYVPLSSCTPYGCNFEEAHFFYRPSIGPQADIAWRYRSRRSPLGVMLRLGVEYFMHSFDHADLSEGLPELPEDLAPMTGSHSGLALVWSIGVTGWE